MKTALVTSIRNEGPYLENWLNHYGKLGVSSAFVYHNDCDDNSLEVMENYRGDLPQLHVIENRIKEGQRPQIRALVDFVEKHATAFDWVIHCDVDEYLVLFDSIQFEDFLTGAPVDTGSILVNWRVFGSSGLKEFSDVPLPYRFNHSCLDADIVHSKVVKSVFRPKAVERIKPHICILKEGYEYRHPDYSVAEIIGEGRTRRQHNTHALFYHYIIKSRDEYLDKMRRGVGTGSWSKDSGRTVAKISHDWSFFDKIDSISQSFDDSFERLYPKG